MKDIKIGDIVLVNGSRCGIVKENDSTWGYWISFDGEDSSAWFSKSFVEPHISKGEETNQYMKNLVRVLNKLR